MFYLPDNDCFLFMKKMLLCFPDNYIQLLQMLPCTLCYPVLLPDEYLCKCNKLAPLSVMHTLPVLYLHLQSLLGSSFYHHDYLFVQVMS